MENFQGIREEKEDVNSRSGGIGSLSETPMTHSPRALRDYALPLMGIPLTIQANNFELKPITLQLLQNIQFMGLPQEDPNTHISNFLEVCDMVKYNSVSDDAIHLRLFTLFKEQSKALVKLRTSRHHHNMGRIGQEVSGKILQIAKTTKIRIEINNFAQLEGESFYEAWDQYKELLHKCPHHSLPKWMQVHHFYNGLNGTTRTLLDASVGGELMSKSENEAE